jgi:hypothetical protein
VAKASRLAFASAIVRRSASQIVIGTLTCTGEVVDVVVAATVEVVLVEELLVVEDVLVGGTAVVVVEEADGTDDVVEEVVRTVPALAILT